MIEWGPASERTEADEDPVTVLVVAGERLVQDEFGDGYSHTTSERGIRWGGNVI